MSKTLVGIATFGNIQFTRLAVESVRNTSDCDVLIVVGKPTDTPTLSWAKDVEVPFIYHDQNYGFPWALNDMYDYAWKEHDYDNLIIMGNDVIAYPHALNSLITIADTTDNEWVCANQVDVRGFCNDFPQHRKCFHGSNYTITDFSHRCWEDFKNYSETPEITSAGLSDVHNLALYKKSVAEKIGYIDVNFYPAYYSDNDYARRSINSGIKACTAGNARYFHFWSRTIHQETGGSNHIFFRNNRDFYIAKWGGDFGSEKVELPFGGDAARLGDTSVILEPTLNITSRDNELEIIKYWQHVGRR